MSRCPIVPSILMIAWAGALCACGNSDTGKPKDASGTQDGIRPSSIDAVGEVATDSILADGGGPVDRVSTMDGDGLPPPRLDGAVLLDTAALDLAPEVEARPETGVAETALAAVDGPIVAPDLVPDAIIALDAGAPDRSRDSSADVDGNDPLGPRGTVQLDALNDAPPAPTVDAPLPPPPWTPSCGPADVATCKDANTLRTCVGGDWVEQPCGNSHICSAGSCRDACPGLVPPSGASVACYMPGAVNASALATATAIVTNEPLGLPTSSVRANALDTLDETPPALQPAPIVVDGNGPIWKVPPSTGTLARLYLTGMIDLAAFTAKNGGAPGEVVLYLKARRITEPGRRQPSPVFSLMDSSHAPITSAEDDTAQLGLSTAWDIRSRAFSHQEIAAMVAGAGSSSWTLLFSDIWSSAPCENVEIAWFALALLPQGMGTLDAGVLDSGSSSLDGMAMDADNAAPAPDGGMDGAGDLCATEGAVECQDDKTLRTCQDGHWSSTPCQAWQVCSAGACHQGCPELQAPTGALIACNMPTDLGSERPTIATLTSDPIAMPTGDTFAGAFESDDPTSENAAYAPTVSHADLTVWRTAKWFSLLNGFGLGHFAASHGGVPESITLFVRLRKIADPSLPANDPWFYLHKGGGPIIAHEDALSWLTPTTEWATYSRSFTTSELAALSLDGSMNSWEIMFDSDTMTTPPEPVEVAWFAMTMVAPNGHYSVSTKVTGTGGGSITSSPSGIACPGACDGTLAIGSQVTLTATPDGNSAFVGWSGDCSGTEPCTLTMTSPKTVSAAFAPRYTSITAGGVHSCAVKPDGTPVCWGDNSLGESGPPASTFTSLSGGLYHTCGVQTSGAAACWGYNNANQTIVPTGSFAAISAGGYHSCGLRPDGSITCWGANNYGQALTPSGTFTSVSVGGYHSCAIASGGAELCWGLNGNGQTAAASGTFSSICAGALFTCGLDSTQTVKCWGDNSYSQTTAPSGTFVALSCGLYHACAIGTDGVTSCWGRNNFQQTAVPSGEFKSVSAGGYHSCALRPNGTAVCWGRNTYGQATPP